eukprot:3960952-Amphidinium_carterae.1
MLGEVRTPGPVELNLAVHLSLQPELSQSSKHLICCLVNVLASPILLLFQFDKSSGSWCALKLSFIEVGVVQSCKCKRCYSFKFLVYAMEVVHCPTMTREWINVTVKLALAIF